MSNNLTQEQIANFKEAFSLFDKDDDGLVQLSDLGLLIRSQNLYPTDDEIKVIQQELRQEGNENIDFPEYVSILTKQFKKQTQDPYEELYEAFKTLDKDKQGYITTNQLQFHMKSLGDKITMDEIKQLIKEGDPNETDQIRYQELARRLTTAYNY